MSKTKEKLEEAKFFLEKLEKHYKESPEVRYFLSAFISAARSVTWVMKSEYQNILGWEEWYNSQTPDTKKMRFLKNMNEIRVKTVKQGPMQIHYMVEFQIPAENFTLELEEFFQKGQGKRLMGKLKIAESDNDRNETVVSGNRVEGTFIFQRAYIMLNVFPDEDVLDVCKEYYSMIEQLVTKCEGLFCI